ncbi:hypothetical protein BBU64B_I0015 (plasmid) [Borreliella burgdorferi 64b]|nr:hypothetical protein BBU64B_I0015 [Borreliella burgdorferi 64b]
MRIFYLTNRAAFLCSLELFIFSLVNLITFEFSNAYFKL